MPRISEIGNWDGQDLDQACNQASTTVKDYLANEDARLKDEDERIDQMIGTKTE